MIRTRVCDLLGIDHPVALGGLGGGHTRPELVAAVSQAGGFGAQGCHRMNPAQIAEAAATLRRLTNRPFALNFLLFHCSEEDFNAGVSEKPAAIAIAWPRPDQDLKPYIARAHDAGCKVTVMAGGVPEATRAAEAGADIIIAQGTEGGGHVGWMASLALTPMVVDAVAPIPVMTAGGVADGRGLAAALALGADGVLLGTRFLATDEAPLHPNFKQAIVDSDGHDTMLTEIPDIASGTVWPGAMSRAARNTFVERWAGREWQLRQNQVDLYKGVVAARDAGDCDEATLSWGQDAGLIHDIVPAAEVVARIVTEAEAILKDRLPALVTD
jgi:NAD(P)H-dependent flavin oxidoreductase YrpB (nitropropane dioxygenase family)